MPVVAEGHALAALAIHGPGATAVGDELGQDHAADVEEKDQKHEGPHEGPQGAHDGEHDGAQGADGADPERLNKRDLKRLREASKGLFKWIEAQLFTAQAQFHDPNAAQRPCQAHHAHDAQVARVQRVRGRGLREGMRHLSVRATQIAAKSCKIHLLMPVECY